MAYSQNKLSPWTKDQALSNLYKYCAIQERCHQDIRTKLIQHQVYGDELEEIISTLISNGFLNEERFARAYVRGKYRMNLWGKNKIIQGLKLKNISPYCIKKGLSEIEEDEYLEILENLIRKKSKTIKEKNPYAFNKKLSNYLIQKGFGFNEFQDLLPKIVK